MRDTKEMKLDYPYTVAYEDVRVRLEVLGEFFFNTYRVQTTWLDETTVRFSGQYKIVTIDCRVEIHPGIVKITGRDPGLLFRAPTRRYLQRKLERYLDPETPIENLPRYDT